MCRLSSSHYDLYRRKDSEQGRSLFEWLRERWRARRSKVAHAEVVPLPTEAAARFDREANHEDAAAA
jgi:hypothetical protein